MIERDLNMQCVVEIQAYHRCADFAGHYRHHRGLAWLNHGIPARKSVSMKILAMENARQSVILAHTLGSIFVFIVPEGNFDNTNRYNRGLP
jgi:hypothetical protein